jgi:hypothetical protein
VNRAIILIDEQRDGGYRAVECLEQSERRGYGFLALMRDVDRALDLLRRHLFSAVIFPSRTLRPTTPPEPDNDDTTVLAVQLPAPRAVGRRSMPLTPDWVRGLADAGSADSRLYETSRLQPRGDDGGLAERFLAEMHRRSRHTADT